MTTTQVEPAAPATSTRSWWPDRRPVQAWGFSAAWLCFGAGWLAIGALEVLNADALGSDGGLGVFQLTIAGTFLAQAGMSASRPGPDRRHVLVYRTAWFATALPPLVAGYPLFFG